MGEYQLFRLPWWRRNNAVESFFYTSQGFIPRCVPTLHFQKFDFTIKLTKCPSEQKKFTHRARRLRMWYFLRESTQQYTKAYFLNVWAGIRPMRYQSYEQAHLSGSLTKWEPDGRKRVSKRRNITSSLRWFHHRTISSEAFNRTRFRKLLKRYRLSNLSWQAVHNAKNKSRYDLPMTFDWCDEPSDRLDSVSGITLAKVSFRQTFFQIEVSIPYTQSDD